MDDKNAFGKPIFYTVKDFIAIPTSKFQLPHTYGKFVYLIQFSEGHLDYPGSDIIAVYHYAGIRRFMWNDRFWNEVELNYREIENKISDLFLNCHNPIEINNYNKLSELLILYNTLSSPDGVRKSSILNQNQWFCRAMYLIN